MLNTRNAKAYAVLSILYDMYGDLTSTLSVDGYVNCREQGFSISCWVRPGISKQVSFAEYRNTDDIVIYYGYSTDFSMQGNVPGNDAYGNAQFFPHNEYVKAAEFIKNWLEK